MSNGYYQAQKKDFSQSSITIIMEISKNLKYRNVVYAKG